jgi:hypothetical protein
MKRKRRLSDEYAFAGFRPLLVVNGIFGDPKARIITLVRRSKKRCATAVMHKLVGTTNLLNACGLYRVVTSAFIWKSKCDEFGVASARMSGARSWTF